MVDASREQISSMQKRLGLRQTGENLEQLKKDLREIVRLQSRNNQRKLGMTRQLYDLFDTTPSENL